MGILDIELNERLHVDIGASCNNNCIFCMEEDRRGRKARMENLAFDGLKEILDANRFRREVVFVSGEPTLSPHFIPAVKRAAELGYERVGVITNGRRFAYLPFARSLLEAGLNVAMVSIHGADAATHDGLTRTPGAFGNTSAGLRNLSALRSEFSLRINTSTVLCRRNTTPEHLELLLEMLSPLVDQMVFNVMQPFGRGDTFFDRLMLPYTELAGRLGRFFAAHKGRPLPIHIVDIPYCCTEGRGIPDLARGYVERYVHFEPKRPGTGRMSAPKPQQFGQGHGEPAGEGGPSLSAGNSPTHPGHSSAPKPHGLLPGGARLKHDRLAAEAPEPMPAGNGLEEKHRDQQERSNKVKRDECRSCAYFNYCDGVWTNYIKRFGWAEFVPV